MNSFKFKCGCEIPIVDGQPDIDFHNLNLTCDRTWNLYKKGYTNSVFQLNSFLGKKYSKELEPDNMEDAAALISIIRPGTLVSKDKNGKSLTQKFCDIKTGAEELDPDNPLSEVAKDTYSIIIYQESIMRMASELAGFSKVDSLKFMKTTAKKDAEALFAFEQKFLDGCAKVGKVSQENAKFIFSNIKNASRYSFNKCSSGKEKIKRLTNDNDYHPTIQEMFESKQYHKSLSMDKSGKIIPNNIKDIRFEGVRETFKITLDSGQNCCVTSNHKFPTPKGNIQLSELNVGDELYLYGNFEQANSLVDLVKIKSIESMGVEKVYDVEMEAPNHTFVFDSGIVSCNSHATAYAILGYQMAWAITHLPKHFLCAQLIHAKNAPSTQEEIRKIASEARRLGIEIKPPSAKFLPATGFFIDGKNIHYALNTIKGCGEKSFTKINKLKINILEMSWVEFLITASDSLNKTQIKNMIRTGCFDFMNVGRKRAEYEYDQWQILTKTEKKQVLEKYKEELFDNLLSGVESIEPAKKRKDTVDAVKYGLINPAMSLEDSISNIVDNEREILGINLTCSKVEKTNVPTNLDKCSEIEFRQKENFIVVGQISEFRQFKIKNGKMKGEFMAAFKMIDEYGECDVVCFPGQLKRFEACLFDGNVCVVDGKISNKGSGLILNEIYEV